MRPARLRRQRPPHSLALSVSVIYTLIVGVGVPALVALPGWDTSAPQDLGSRPDTTVSRSTYPQSTTPTGARIPSPSRTTTTDPALDFVPVSGGGGIVTAVPVGWQQRSRSPTLDEAVDPIAPSRLLRYGGAPAADGRPLVRRITDAEQDISSRKDGYQRVRLESVEFHAMEAVAWEFEYYDAGDWLRCSAHYWMASGIEYVLYIQSQRSDWEATKPVLQYMIESAGPVQ